MKRFFLFFFFSLFSLSLPFGYKQLTSGFRLAKLWVDFPYDAKWDTVADANLESILGQNYQFLGKGTQSYVFESVDGEYVVKFFRFDRLKNEDIPQFFQSAKIAYDFLREETGLIYLHLNPTRSHLPILQCKDAIGRTIHLPLDQLRFAIQKKAIPFRSCLGSKERLEQFSALLKKRAAKKIRNRDSNLSRNFGFLADRAIEIDFGSFYFDPDLDEEEEVGRYLQKL